MTVHFADPNRYLDSWQDCMTSSIESHGPKAIYCVASSQALQMPHYDACSLSQIHCTEIITLKKKASDKLQHPPSVSLKGRQVRRCIARTPFLDPAIWFIGVLSEQMWGARSLPCEFPYCSTGRAFPRLLSSSCGEALLHPALDLCNRP